MLSLAQHGRFSDSQSWHEIQIILLSQETSVLKQMRVFERYARQKRYSDQQAAVLHDQYLMATEVQLALKSSKRHFALDLIQYFQQGSCFMQMVLDKKIKPLTNP